MSGAATVAGSAAVLRTQYDGAKKKGLALVMEGSPEEEASESSDEGLLEAMQVFEAAKTSEAKAAALKDFIQLVLTSKGK